MSTNERIKKMEWNGMEYCAHPLSRIQLFATPWIVAHQARISQARILEQVAISFRGSSRPRDQTHAFCTGRWILYHCTIWEAPVEYYSAIKKNETMPFAATWMGLEIIILIKSERKRQTPCDTTYMWNLKYGHELIYKVEQTQMQRMKTCGCQGGGVWEGWMGSLRLADASYFT